MNEWSDVMLVCHRVIGLRCYDDCSLMVLETI